MVSKEEEQALDALVLRESKKYDDRLQRITDCYNDFKNCDKCIAQKGLTDRHRAAIDYVAIDEFLLGCTPPHWSQIHSMAEFAASDLKEVVRLELDTAKAYADDLKRTNEREALSHVLEKNAPLQRFTHSFFSRISTLLDNLYCLVADYYYKDTYYFRQFGMSMRKGVEYDVGYCNPRLSDFMKDRFDLDDVQKEFNNLRNSFLHDIPKMSIEADCQIQFRPDERLGYREKLTSFEYNAFLEIDARSRKEKLFEYLFGIYEHVLKNTLEAYLMLLETPRPQKDSV